MFKRIFDFFKRDKAKLQQPKTTTVQAPAPRRRYSQEHQGWIDKLVQRAKSIALQKQIDKGAHIARPQHCIKPLREIRPTRKFYSTSDIK
jgi:hypothetical protein